MRRRLEGRRLRLEHRCRRDQLGVILVEARHRERAGSDRLSSERRRRELVDRDVCQQMCRGDRLGRCLEEPAERRREREHDGPRALDLDADLVPRPCRRTRVRRVLEDVDGVRDIVRGHGLTVVPPGVIAQLERPRRTGVVHRPVFRQVRDERPVRAVADETREDERHEVAVGLGLGGQRADRHRAPEDALAIRPGRDRARGRLGRGDGRCGGEERRGADEARDECEQYDQGPDDERVGAGQSSSERSPDRGGPPRCRIRRWRMGRG